MVFFFHELYAVHHEMNPKNFVYIAKKDYHVRLRFWVKICIRRRTAM